MKRLTPFPDDVEAQNKSVQGTIPLLDGIGTVEDMANLALFLASPAARVITSTTIVIDGAQHFYNAAMIPREMMKEVVQQQMAVNKQRKAKL